MINAKVFSLEDANRALPLVRAIVRDVAETSRRRREMREKVEATSGEGKGKESGPPTPELLANMARVSELERELKAHVQELEGLGCYLKDYDLGLVDFPSFVGGELVYLCWHLGEERVAYWHGIKESYRARKAVPSHEGEATARR